MNVFHYASNKTEVSSHSVSRTNGVVTSKVMCFNASSDATFAFSGCYLHNNVQVYVLNSSLGVTLSLGVSR